MTEISLLVLGVMLGFFLGAAYVGRPLRGYQPKPSEKTPVPPQGGSGLIRLDDRRKAK